MRIGRTLSVVFAGLSFFPALAQAASQQTFVSAQRGSDKHPCSIALPCRSFATAIAATLAGGEVIVLDSGSYGSVTISQAVSIEAPVGIYAGIPVLSGDGITVAAGSADIVILRGLTINGAGTTGNGITITSAGTVHLENCTISGFGSGYGVIGHTGGFNLFLKDSFIRECKIGMFLSPTSGTVAASIDRCRLEDNPNNTLSVEDNAKVSIRDSVVSGGGYGIFAVTINNATFAEINVDNCMVANNGVGVFSDGLALTNGGLVRVSHSTVTDNVGGLVQSGTGTLLSRGNNTVEGNTSDDESGTIGTYSAK